MKYNTHVIDKSTESVVLILKLYIFFNTIIFNTIYLIKLIELAKIELGGDTNYNELFTINVQKKKKN